MSINQILSFTIHILCITFVKYFVCLLYKEIKIAGNKIIVFFNFSTDRLKTSDGKALRGFEISGKDGNFIEATAKISKDKVIVKNKNIKHPVDVRYAWKPFADANLINSAGLPASTFTTRTY